jgi:hypothetical protein
VEQSALGVLIDSSMEDFKKEADKMNVGTINGLVLLMSSAYNELNVRREAIMASDTISLDDKTEAVKGLFCEMVKIEEKVIYLKNRAKDLLPQVFDTKKH